MSELDDALEKIKQMQPGTYLLAVRKGVVRRAVLDRLGTEDVKFIIIEFTGLGIAEENFALYRLAPEKPL